MTGGTTGAGTVSTGGGSTGAGGVTTGSDVGNGSGSTGSGPGSVGNTISGNVGSGDGLGESEGVVPGFVSVANAGWVPKNPRMPSSKASTVA
ncbi:hypothetical protein [Paenarthrobacter sp. NPDC058233]|uniref:hypothetical protein n=1 Tax=Paenarthrobacter sp. NPDC058233 TaxID=3346394 RepID=UPI0036DA2D54